MARSKKAVSACEIATEMRVAIGWAASNLEDLALGDIASYEINSLRSQLLELLALANRVEELDLGDETQSEEPAARAVQSVRPKRRAAA